MEWKSDGVMGCWDAAGRVRIKCCGPAKRLAPHSVTPTLHQFLAFSDSLALSDSFVFSEGPGFSSLSRSMTNLASAVLVRALSRYNLQLRTQASVSFFR